QASPVAQAPAPKRKQRKARKRLAVPEAAGPNDNRQQLSVNSKPTFPGSVPEVIHEAEQSPEKPSVAESVQIVLKAEASAAWIPPCPMCQWPPPGSSACLRCKGIAELVRARKARSQTNEKPPADGIPNSPLCSRCWSLGYAACGPCGAAHNPALRDWDGSYTKYGFPRLRPLTEDERSWAWSRCHVCYNPYQGPRFVIPNLCPTCRAGPAICTECGGRDRAHLRVCRRYIQDTTPVACGKCGKPLPSNEWCDHCRTGRLQQRMESEAADSLP